MASRTFKVLVPVLAGPTNNAAPDLHATGVQARRKWRAKRATPLHISLQPPNTMRAPQTKMHAPQNFCKFSLRTRRKREFSKVRLCLNQT